MQFAGPAFSFPLTNEQLDKSLSDKNRFAFRVVNDKTNFSIGHSEIYLTDQSAYLGRILIGDKEQRGKGLGRQIVNLLLDFIFSNLDKTKVELNVFDWNIGAIKCYEKVGFVINPDKKNQRKIKNEIWTALNMSIDKSKWKELQANKEAKIS
jgi:RimJ/RimL family protein N-acetyltransferase